MPNSLSDSLVEGSRTVVDIAAHFERLKVGVHELLESSTVRDRGYFTPTDDERTRQLLISYWHPRNALIGLVSTTYFSEHDSEDDRLAGFLVAYAGALVLIDAARFLREQFQDREIVRGKLNEPEPHFGIAEGTYDTVQKSLTSPTHVWHLYHAMKFVEEFSADLERKASESPEQQPLWDLIQRLQHRLDVSLTHYSRTRLRVRTRDVVTRFGRNLLWRALYGLQKAVSSFMSDKYVKLGHDPHLSDNISAELKSLLQPGDVLVTRKEHAFTNFFLPGFWPHAALYLGTTDDLQGLDISSHENVTPRWGQLQTCDPDRPERVLESMRDGVRIRSIACPFHCDAIAVIRPRLTRPDIAEALSRGLFHEGKPYDFDFDFTRSDRLVCTEVVYRSYEGVGGVGFELAPRHGRLTLAAEDLLHMSATRNSFETVAVYSPSHGDQIQHATAADDVLRATVASLS